jgi:tol-pal system protein YbgF
MTPIRMPGILLALLAVAVLMTGCAATNSYMDDKSQTGSDQDVSELDEMLGIGGDEGSEESINEDDVLKLLGVSDETPLESETAYMPSEQSEAETGFEEAPAQAPAPGDASAVAAAPSDRTTAAPAWKSDSYSSRYQEALQAYRAKRLGESIQKFESLLAENAKNSLADNCQYWIGEAYYDQGQYNQAILSFEKVFSYPSSNKDDSAQLKLGLCYVKLNDRTKAREEFQKLLNNYPSSEYIGIARQFIAQIEGPASAQ